jgi:hypothetical protein
VLFFQRIKHKITSLTAKVQVAERALGDTEGQLETIYQCRRSKDAITSLPAEFFDAHQLIPDIPVDFAVSSYDRLGDIDRKAIDEVVACELCKQLGERGRAP